MRGLWQYLSIRAVARAEVDKARIALEKDRERNLAVASYIAQLPVGAELADFEDSTGRKIWIRQTACGPQCASGPHPGAVVVPEDAAMAARIASAEHEIAGESATCGPLS